MGIKVRRVRRKRRHDRRQPERRRVLIFAGAIGLGFLLGFSCLRYAPHAYISWREGRLLNRASELLEQGDLDGAKDAAHQILRLQPDSLLAYQILAGATEKQNLTETVAWRAQVARLLPDDLDAHLNLASAALRFGQLDTARHALESVAPDDRDKAAYHVVAGWLARAQGNEADVEQHFAAAVKQEPKNDLYQFNFAVLQIRSPDPEKMSAARTTLERLSKVQAYRAGSLRALLSDAVQQNELERADHFAQDLQMSQQVTFADLLLCLEFYRKLDEKKFTALVERVKPVAARNANDTAQLVEWMTRNGLAAEGLKWTDKLPAEFTASPPPAIAIAEAFAEVKNWSRLKRWTRSGGWGDSDYLRLAYQAFAARQLRQSSADAEFTSLWSSAEKLAADHPDRELVLARLAAKWNLALEARGLWKRVAKNPPMRREALDALFKIYRTANDLPELLLIAKQLHESSPRESLLASNYARLALLLAPNTEEAQKTAKDAYDAAPADPNCAVTYAFALYSTGRTAQGLEVLEKIPPADLQDPHSALFVALLRLDNNQPELAKDYIEAAQKGPLYMEEKKLLDEALAKVAVPPAEVIPSPAPVSPTAPAASPSAAPTEPVAASSSPSP